MHDVSEIQIIPIKAKNGLVGYASFVLDNILYFSSIGIITRPQGGFRLLFPTKDFATGVSKIFYPINKEFAYSLESKIADKFREVTGL
ncbi:septation protein SpoVG family protein [Patescibacteria group bacterium]|nr:septation protein SpoVG family protein [Patescibacteria group bacterium]